MYFLRLLSLLPLGVLYRLSDFAFVVVYYILRYRRALVRGNLKNAFPTQDEPTLSKIEKAFYRNLCDHGLETVKLLTISQEELRERMKFNNPEILQAYADSNQSVIILASHQFNWEWLLAAGCFRLPMPVDFVYQLQKGSSNHFLLQCRARFGGHPIIRNDVAKEAVVRKKITRATAIMADQFPGHHNDKRNWITFLNQETAFFQGIEGLAQLTQMPVFYFSVRKLKRGFYEAEGMLLASPPFSKGRHEVIERYVYETEKVVRANPDGWLWSHNRWKLSKAECEALFGSGH